LERGSKGLGFAIMDGSISGEKGIFIKTVIPGGPAASVGGCFYFLVLMLRHAVVI